MEGKHGRSSGSGTTLGVRNERGGLQGTHTGMGTWVAEAADERSWRIPASRAERDESEEQHRKTHTDTGHRAAGRQKDHEEPLTGRGGGWPALKPRWAPSHTTYLLRPGTDPGTGLPGREPEVRAGGPAAPVLTTGSAVLDGDGGLLLALGFLPLALVAVGAAVAGAEGPVGAVAGEALAGAARGAAAVQADPVVLALLLAFVCGEGIQLPGSPRGRGARGGEGG